MIVLSLERLGAVNRQPNLSASISWLNQLLSAGVDVYQAMAGERVQTDRFPEGHVYPAGTVFVDRDLDGVPSVLVVDKTNRDETLLGRCRRLRLPRQIGVYNGLNCAEFCFDPYHDMFRDYGFRYVELKDDDIRGGALSDCDVLVVPGGPDAGESYYAGLGDLGFEEIRKFVAGGGKYLGSCAGAYFPLRARPGTPEERMWLGLVEATDTSGLDYWRTGTGFVRVAMHSSPSNSVLFGLSYGQPSTVDVIYWEGPAFHEVGDDVEVIATYEEFLSSGSQLPNWKPNDNQCATDALCWTNPLTSERFNRHLRGVPAAIASTYGEGRVILFSFHPEFGNPTLPWTSNPVHLFLINSIYTLASL